jgi:hypothetical protein
MDCRDMSRSLLAVAVGAAGCSRSGPSAIAEAQASTATGFAITAAEIYANIPASSINTSVPPYRADRYGFSNAAGASGSANAIALRYAVTAATAASAGLRIPGSAATTTGVPPSQPGGTPYPYISSAVLEFTCDVEGDGVTSTVISCSGGTGGKAVLGTSSLTFAWSTQRDTRSADRQWRGDI